MEGGGGGGGGVGASLSGGGLTHHHPPQHHHHASHHTKGWGVLTAAGAVLGLLVIHPLALTTSALVAHAGARARARGCGVV